MTQSTLGIGFVLIWSLVSFFFQINRHNFKISLVHSFSHSFIVISRPYYYYVQLPATYLCSMSPKTRNYFIKIKTQCISSNGTFKFRRPKIRLVHIMYVLNTYTAISCMCPETFLNFYFVLFGIKGIVPNNATS